MLLRREEGCCASAQITKYAHENGITRSMGSTGICWDAMAEALNSLYKAELIHLDGLITVICARRLL